MAGQSSAMFGWSCTEVSVLSSPVFGQALKENCDNIPGIKKKYYADPNFQIKNNHKDNSFLVKCIFIMLQKVILKKTRQTNQNI